MKDKNQDNKNLQKGISIFYATDNKTEVYVHPEVTYPEFMQLLSTLMLHGMNAYYGAFKHSIHTANLNQRIKSNQHKIPKDATLKESELEEAYLNAAYSIHDLANISVSNVLKMFLPDELGFLNPENLITNEAILKAEEDCLNNLLDSLDPAQKELAELRLAKIKDELKEAKDNYARMQFEQAQKEQLDTDEQNNE